MQHIMIAMTAATYLTLQVEGMVKKGSTERDALQSAANRRVVAMLRELCISEFELQTMYWA